MNWTGFWSENNRNNAWAELKKNYADSLDICAPLIEVNNVKSADSWVNSELIVLIRERDSLKNELDLCDELVARTGLLKEFKKKRNEVGRMVIKAKKSFTSSNLHSCEHNPKLYWKSLN